MRWAASWTSRPGVKPQFERLNGEDQEAFILSINVAQRHLNKGQIAIVIAKAYPEVAEPGRGKKGLVSKAFPMVNESALSQARTIVRYAPRNNRLAASREPPAPSSTDHLDVNCVYRCGVGNVAGPLFSTATLQDLL
jgi:hypothetical protein